MFRAVSSIENRWESFSPLFSMSFDCISDVIRVGVRCTQQYIRSRYQHRDDVRHRIGNRECQWWCRLMSWLCTGSECLPWSWISVISLQRAYVTLLPWALNKQKDGFRIDMSCVFIEFVLRRRGVGGKGGEVSWDGIKCIERPQHPSLVSTHV